MEDVRMNIEVLKCCGAVLLLESSLPNDSWISAKTRDFLKLDDISLPYIFVPTEPDHFGSEKIQILHGNVPWMKLSYGHLKILSRIGPIEDDYGLQKLSFLVHPSPNLSEILAACDSHAYDHFRCSGSSSEWHPLIKNEALRLRLQTVKVGNFTHSDTEIYWKDSSGSFSRLDDRYQIESLFIPGNYVDAYFSLDAYDYQQKTSGGIRLVAQMLVLHDF